MPEAVEGHEEGRSKVGGATGGGRSQSRDPRHGSVSADIRSDRPVGDRPGRAGLADTVRDQPATSSASGYHEERMDRVAGWRDAARRAARRLTADRSALADYSVGHDQDLGPADSATTHDGGTYLEDAPRRPRGRPYSRSLEFDVDWARASVFGSGLALGALIGACVALLTAPESGSRTRQKIADAGRRAGGRAADAWDGLGDDLRVVRAKTRRDVKRGLRGSRRDVAKALSDLDQRAMDGLRTIRDLRRSRSKEHGRDASD